VAVQRVGLAEAAAQVRGFLDGTALR